MGIPTFNKYLTPVDPSFCQSQPSSTPVFTWSIEINLRSMVTRPRSMVHFIASLLLPSENMSHNWARQCKTPGACGDYICKACYFRRPISGDEYSRWDILVYNWKWRRQMGPLSPRLTVSHAWECGGYDLLAYISCMTGKIFNMAHAIACGIFTKFLAVN